MNKRNVCRTATVLCGLLAILIHTQPDTSWPTDKLMGTALMLMSAIFGTQWAEYQKRHDATSDQPDTPAWLRRLLFSSLLLLTMTGTNAQTTWTNRPQTSNQGLSDMAYGAGKYVAVGGDGIGEFIKTSPDGITWTSQVIDNPPTGGLYTIVYAGGQFVVVGASGRVLTSPDGLTWTSQVSGLGVTSLLSSIAYGGGQFMAVGFDGVAITSPDGVTWTTLTTGVSTDFLNITYGGGRFIAVGKGGLIRTTLNGIIWIERISGTSADLRGVTVGSNGRLVAVGENSTIVTSADGITWTKRLTPGSTGLLTAVAYDPLQGFVAVSEQTNVLVTSVDGLSWTAHPSGTSLSLWGVRSINGQYFALGGQATVRLGIDPTDWRPLTINADVSLVGIAYGNDRYVAVGSYLANPGNSPKKVNVAVTSADGIQFVFGEPQQMIANTNGFNDVAFGNGLFVAVGENANVQTSADGKVWISRYVSLTKSLDDIAYGGGQFVAVGANGLVVRSTDGITWIASSTGPGNISYAGITYANGQFVAVGSNNIGTSPDGISWTTHTLAANNFALTSVAYGNGTYVAVGIGVGVNSSVARSADGITWTVTPSLPGNVFDITFGNGQFVIVGQIGFIGIKTSPDGVSWTDRVPNVTGVLRGLTYVNGQFIAVGNSASVVTSPNDGGVPVNQAPTVANAIPNQVGTVNQNFSYSIPANTFTDPNGDALTLSIAGLPNGLNLNGSTISGTPASQGTSTVTVTATDGGNLSVNTQFTLTINPAVGNPSALVITGVTLVSCQALSATQRQLVFTPQYAGSNGQPISFEVVNEMVPTTNAGPYTLGMYTDNPTIALKATQSGTPGQASFSYNWLAVCSGGVPSGNQPPLAPVIPDATATVGQVYAQTIPLFTDPEGQPLTYSVSGLPPGLLVTGGGNIVGPPSTAGVYVITVTATDPGGLSAGATYTLTIYPAGGNPGTFTIKEVTLVSCQAVSATQRQLVFTPQYAGTNGQPISFEVVNEMVPTTNAGPYSLGMYIDNPTIILKATQSGTPGEASFSYDWSSACGTIGARQGVRPTAESALGVRVLGNPVENGTLSVEVRGAGGRPVQMNLSDLRGQVVGSHQVTQADSVEQHTFEMGQQPAGLYLLRVSTPTQMQTVKVLKR